MLPQRRARRFVFLCRPKFFAAAWAVVVAGALGACGPDAANPAMHLDVPVQTRNEAATFMPNATSSRLALPDGSGAAITLANANVTGTTGLTSGMRALPPASFGDLNVTFSAVFNANAVGKLTASANGTLPFGLDSNATLRVPRRSAIGYAINNGRKDRNLGRLDLNVRLTAADLDPVDARFRLRAVVVPVLNPAANHDVTTQSFAFVGARTLAGTELGASSTYANQPGVPFRASGVAGAYAYTDWQLVEIVPHVDAVRVGEDVQLSVLGASCGAGGHYGAAYLDELGSYDAGGTTLVADGPQLVGAGNEVTYVLRLREQRAQDGATPAPQTSDLNVELALPANTNFVAFAAPDGWSCTVPPANANGVTCRAPALACAQQQRATLTLRAGAASPNVTLLGNYGVRTSATGMLLGPARQLTVVDAATAAAFADLSVTVRENAAAATEQTSTCEVLVRNLGPAAAPGTTLLDAAGDHLQVRSWRCIAQGNATATSSSPTSGTGSLATAWDLAAGANVACTVVLARDGSGLTDTYGVRAATAGNVVDPMAINNDAASFVLGALPPQPVPDAVDLSDANAAPVSGAPATKLGVACSDDATCDGGHCVDGVCCNSACAGPCTACNVPGSRGACTALDGRSPEHGSCGPYLCAAGACASACATDAQCRTGFTCTARVCRPTVGRCATDSDCGAGEHCTAATTCESLAAQDANHPNWRLEGSGCAAGAHLGGGGLLPLAALWLRRRRRRPRAAPLGASAGIKLFVALAVIGAVGTALPAHAADPRDLSTNAFTPLGGMHDIFGAAAAPRSAVGSGVVGGYVNYAHAPLRLRHLVTPQVNQDVVAHQVSLDLFGGVALPHLGELDVALPVVLQQNRPAPFYHAALLQHHWQGSLGDLRLTPKWTFWAHEVARLAVALPTRLPTGRRGALVGRGDVTVTPTLVADLGATSGPRLLVNLGAALQNRRVLADVDVHHALVWQMAGEVPLRRYVHAPLYARAAAFGQMDLTRPRGVTSPVELLGGLAVALPLAWQFEAGAGGGLDRGWGAPRWRVLLGLRWQPERVEQPRLPVSVPVDAPEVVPAQNPAPTSVAAAFDTPIVAALDPNGDADGDGLRNADDLCPTVAGDLNGPVPGCPAPAAAARLVHTFRLVHFASGEAQLTPGDEPALRQVREVLLALPGARLEVAGHTDNLGARRDNVRLSRQRAEAARRWLVSRGVAPERVVARGYGGSRPEDPRPTGAARAANRRVVFTLLPATPLQPGMRAAPRAANQVRKHAPTPNVGAADGSAGRKPAAAPQPADDTVAKGGETTGEGFSTEDDGEGDDG